MIVIRPRRRENEVARVHHRPLPFDRRVGAGPLHDEAEGGGGVTMGRSHFAGQNQLEAGIQALCDAGLSAQARVLEHEHAALGFLCRQQAAGLEKQGPQLVIPPYDGHRIGCRLRRDGRFDTDHRKWS